MPGTRRVTVRVHPVAERSIVLDDCRPAGMGLAPDDAAPVHPPSHVFSGALFGVLMPVLVL